jgi:hypothetical protein
VTTREFLKKYKEHHKCIVCREDDVNCLEFHHLNKKDKLFSLSHRLKSTIDPKDVLREMNKTCLLCSNCHRKYHGGTLNVDDKFLEKNKVNVLISDYDQEIN